MKVYRWFTTWLTERIVGTLLVFMPSLLTESKISKFFKLKIIKYVCVRQNVDLFDSIFKKKRLTFSGFQVSTSVDKNVKKIF